ncbi:hypothetical protein QTP70_025449 [Hemibagrus guttatus]|uniref:ribonuclease H n=1 Tax=Hemibagrus guttatus TaxID=175788 RepID=A0AAE0QNH4_9TELE|nr:hypothetical protein QTP70_025449 [Hemibagrus guttatus]
MSACNAFTEHVWKPGECKNCFKPKSLHRLPEGGPHKCPPEQVLSQHSHTSTGDTNNINYPSHSPTGGRAIVNANLASNPQRSSSSSRSGQFRPPVAKKPTIAVKPTMMLPCSGGGLDLEGNPPNLPEGVEPGKASAFTIWNHNGLNRKRPSEPNNNERNDERREMEGFASVCPPSSKNNGLTDVLKEIAGLGSDLSSSRDDFLGRISCSYRRSLERGLPAAGCLALGHSNSANKHVSLSDSAEIISSEGGRFCYPEFSSDGEEDEEYEEESESDDGEHESWDESDEELLAMEIRMRGQPRFANFRAATLSPVPFAAGKKWNTVPLRNRSLQRICAVDYDSYDEILNGYPSIDSSGAPSLLPYGSDPQGSGFLSNSESITSPESSSSLPEDSCNSSSSSSVPRNQLNGLHPIPVSRDSAVQQDRALSSPKATETHKAVLAIRLQDQDVNQREGGPLPQALPGQPITISFSPTEEQPKPYRVVSLEKTPICKPYTVVDVSASMASTEERTTESTAKPKGPCTALGPPPYPGASKNIPLSASLLSPKSPISPKTPISPKCAAISPTTPVSQFTSVSPSVPVSLSTALANVATSSPSCKNSRYQEVWTSSTSPRQKLPKVELLTGTPTGSSVTPRHANHKSAPTSPIAGISSSRTIPVKSPNLSEIKFNSYNNAGMPPFPIIIRDEPTYARCSKNAVKVPIVINPSAYDNLAVYKSFLGVSGELPQPKPGTGSRVPSHTYEEIGSSEAAQSSPTEHKPTRKFVSADTKEERNFIRTVPHNDKAKNTPECSTAANISVTVSNPWTNGVPTPSTASSSLTKSNSVKLASSFNPSDDSPAAGSSECQTSTSTGTGHREKASMVLSQLVASIQPPQSPPDSPSAQSKTCSAEELYSLPPDATKGTLSRPKSLHCPTDSSLSKSYKDTPSKLLPKSQSASAAEGSTSPKSEPSAPFPPPRSTSSPYHASNLLQRHFSNWTRPMGSRPSDGEVSPGAEGRRSADSNRPKRWISFKSFFRRRKDEDEQKEKVEREKEKGKLVGLDGTVITMLPPPPLQRQHWFSESKTDDPNQKPTIIFTYKPDSGSGGDGEAELRVEECNTGAGGVLSFNQSGPPKSRASLLISKVMSQMPVQGSETDMPTITSLPAKVDLPTVSEPANLSTTISLGEPEEDEGTQTHSHSHSPASSSCSATYTNLGQTEEFKVEVGLHQGSALSPFLFAIVMGQLSEEVRQESPWTMMFADDIVICSESREQVEENLERWRFALERRGMKVSRSKTEYMCVNEREGSGTVRLQGEEVKKVQEFKYLGSTVQSNGECGKEVKKRVQAVWNGWRKVSGVLCDRKISARIKGQVYRTVVRPAMLYGLETVSLRTRQEAELKMLRFSLGVTRLDRIRNEYIRGTAHVGSLGDKVREAYRESQSRASLIPTKHPRHLKTSDDGVHSESEGFNLGAKVTPPPLPKKSVPRANTEPSLTIEPMTRRPRGEAKPKPGGASLSMANPLYDLDSTWDTASQSSSLSSDARQLDESGDSLERPVAGGRSMSRSTNSSSAPDRERRGYRSTESLAASKTHRLALYRGLESWEEVASRIRSLHADTLRKLAGRCEDRFMAGQKDHLRFGTDSWSHFRLTTGKPCCEAEDAVYYTASYAKDPLTNYAVKICRYKVKETQQQFFHSLAVRQSLPVHFNIQQDCGHFLADVPARLLPWEDEYESDDERDEKRPKERNLEQKGGGSKELLSEGKRQAERGHRNIAEPGDMACHGGKLRSRVVVITREVPFQTVADFVQEGSARHSRNPELYERQVCLLLLQLCTGLEHMKPYHVSHCDLHLKNLLLVHCQPGDPWNLELPEPNNNTTSASSACPARLIISNFSQAKQQSIVQYTECDEFQLGLLIYEMLHQPSPFVEVAGLKEREQLPLLPTRSLYSQGLQRLASLLLHTDESERIGVAEARACLQCLLWGPRDDLLRAAPLPIQRHAALQNWLDLKRTLMMIKFAERSLDASHSGGGVSLEDWLCCKYLAFATTDSIDRVIRVLQQI